MYSKPRLLPGRTPLCGVTFLSWVLTSHKLPLHNGEVKPSSMVILHAEQLRCPVLQLQYRRLDLCSLPRYQPFHANRPLTLSLSLYTLLSEAGASLPQMYPCPTTQTRVLEPIPAEMSVTQCKSHKLWTVDSSLSTNLVLTMHSVKLSCHLPLSIRPRMKQPLLLLTQSHQSHLLQLLPNLS
jgi:hypothetical protein